MKKNVFISYSSAETETAYMVKGILEKNGIGCWMGADSIDFGKDFALEIAKGISECEVLVLLLSEQAQKSPWVQKEVKMAISKEKIVIPFAIEKCDLTEAFSYVLSDIQRWNAYEELSVNLEKLVKQLKAILDVNIKAGFKTDKKSTEEESERLKAILEKIEQENYEEGISLLEEMANKQNSQAQYELGNIYDIGLGTEVDYEKAFLCFEKSARSGNVQATSRLARLYLEGYGVERDIQKAYEYYRAAATEGDADAQYVLGCSYENVEDLIEAGEWHENAYQNYYQMAVEGDIHSIYQLADIWNGYGVKADEETASEYYGKIMYVLNKNIEKQSAREKFRYAKALSNIDEGKYSNSRRDYTKAFEWYERAAESNLAEAQLEMGRSYQNGKGVEKDLGQALQWYARAARQGNSHASKCLGDMFYHGNGVEQNINEAIRWYEMGAKPTDADVLYEIGDRYYFGTEMDSNYSKAYEWYSYALKEYEYLARHGNAQAQYRSGKMYMEGIGTKRDYKKSRAWLLRAARHADGRAMFELGNLYYLGYDLAPDYEKAMEWYRKAEEKEIADAVFMIGTLYSDWDSSQYDSTKAERYFRKAFDAIYDKEEKSVEDYYYLWKSSRYTKDARYISTYAWTSEILEEYERRAALGDVNCMYKLAYMLRYENISPNAETETFSWFKRAAEEGDERAQYELSELFYYGKGIVENKKNAVEWMKASAKQGYWKAESKLGSVGSLYEVEKSEECEWLEKAAAKGCKEALREMGNNYYHGLGVKLNQRRGIRYLLRSVKKEEASFKVCKEFAERGDAKEQILLSYMYKEGIGVEINPRMALLWRLKALPGLWKDYSLYRGLQKAHEKENIEENKVKKDLQEEYERTYQLMIESQYKYGVEEMRELASQGLEKAQNQIAYMQYRGLGMKKNVRKAYKTYQKLAAKGNMEAIRGLEEIARSGEQKLVIIKDEWYQAAIENCKQAAIAGDQEAQYELGEIYSWGIHGIVKEDKACAREWFEKAARQGHMAALYYCIPGNVEDKLKMAICEEAARKGNTWARGNLEYGYSFGQVYKQNPEYRNRVVDLLFQDLEVKRENQNYEFQMLGEMYYNGYGVEQNYKTAFEYCEKAAKAGDVFAQYKLGHMYYSGHGVAVDKKESCKWFKKGLAQTKELEMLIPDEIREMLNYKEPSGDNEEKKGKNESKYKLKINYCLNTGVFTVWNNNVFVSIHVPSQNIDGGMNVTYVNEA